MNGSDQPRVFDPWIIMAYMLRCVLAQSKKIIGPDFETKRQNPSDQHRPTLPLILKSHCFNMSAHQGTLPVCPTHEVPARYLPTTQVPGAPVGNSKY